MNEELDHAQKRNPDQALVSEALKDGRLTLREANAIYRANHNPNFELTVDASKLRVSPYGPIPENGSVKAKVANLGDWLVHGNVSLTSVQGTLSIASEQYDFDYKPWFSNVSRNIETYIGEVVAGEGTSFRINFDGSPSIEY